MKYILPAGTNVDVILFNSMGRHTVFDVMTDLSIVIEIYKIIKDEKEKCHTYRHQNSETIILYFYEKDLMIR